LEPAVAPGFPGGRPRELAEIATARGVSVEKLVEAVETLLLREAKTIAMESKLEMKTALEIARKSLHHQNS